MPELPEVEVTRRAIAPLLVGRTIARVRTTKDSYFFLTPPVAIARGLRLRRVQSLERVGKYLVMALDSGANLVVHLGMTGQLVCSAAQSPRLVRAGARASWVEAPRAFRADQHTHLQLSFADGGPKVMLRDVRKFGKCALRGPGEPEPRLERLGVDALAVNGARLHSAASRRTLAVKSLLLDQSVLAGVGNIYADEALFRARILPQRSARTLSSRQCGLLARAIRHVLTDAIAAGGSSIDDYVHPDGSDGGYHRQCAVYGRQGEACPRCGRRIQRIVLSQRSSHYCPGCQK